MYACTTGGTQRAERVKGVLNPNFRPLIPRLHMQIWQPGTEQKACQKVFYCCQARAIVCLWSG